MAEQSYVDISLSELREALQQLEGEDYIVIGGDARFELFIVS